jgi:hypothetical protein
MVARALPGRVLQAAFCAPVTTESTRTRMSELKVDMNGAMVLV